MVPQPPLQKLSAERLTREGAFLMDCGSVSALCDSSSRGHRVVRLQGHWSAGQGEMGFPALGLGPGRARGKQVSARQRLVLFGVSSWHRVPIRDE